MHRRKTFEPLKITVEGTFLVVQWLRLHLPMQGAWVQSLLGKLRSHMLNGISKKRTRQKEGTSYHQRYRSTGL